MIGRCARSLDKYDFGARTRDMQWGENLDQLHSSYASDRRYAPQYPLKDLNSTSRFSRGLMKLKLKSDNHT